MSSRIIIDDERGTYGFEIKDLSSKYLLSSDKPTVETLSSGMKEALSEYKNQSYSEISTGIGLDQYLLSKDKPTVETLSNGMKEVLGDSFQEKGDYITNNDVIGKLALSTLDNIKGNFLDSNTQFATINNVSVKSNTNFTVISSKSDLNLGELADKDISDLNSNYVSVGYVMDGYQNSPLVHQNFVNSSIATQTASFRGTKSSKEDLGGISASNNDYAFVSSFISAGLYKYDRYKCSADTYRETISDDWLFEYTLNNSSFTDAQWSAINSGILSSTAVKHTEKTAIGNTSTPVYVDVDGYVQTCDVIPSDLSDLSDTSHKYALCSEVHSIKVDNAINADNAGVADKINVLSGDEKTEMEIVLCSSTPEIYENGKIYFVLKEIS